MFYDSRGRKLRRAIGYLAEWRLVDEPKAEPVDLVSSDWAEPDDDEIPDEMNIEDVLAEQTAELEARREKQPDAERAPVVHVPRPRPHPTPEPKK